MVDKLSFKKPSTKIPLAPVKNGLYKGKISLSGNKRAPLKTLQPVKEDEEEDEDDDTPISFPSFPINKSKPSGNQTSGNQTSGNSLRRFDKLINAHKKKATDKKRSSSPPPPPPASFQRSYTRGASAPLNASKAPENISDDDSDSASFSSDSMSMSSSASSSMSGSSRDIPLDDSMSILSSSSDRSRAPKQKGGKPNMFSSLTNVEAEEAEKSDLLARFYLLKQRGVHVSKTYSPKSSLNEMRMEMGRIEHEAQVANAIKMNRRMLVAGVSAFETASESYGPRLTRGKFHRVSHFVTNSIKDYDSAFERLSERYGGVIGAVTDGNPLYEIFLTLIYQMVTYAVFYRGAETAKANEDLTMETLKNRFPDILRQAVDAEIALRQQQQQPVYPTPNQEQQHFRRTFEQPVQQMQQTQQAPGMAGPSIGIGKYQQPTQQQEIRPSNVNMENPSSFAYQSQRTANEMTQKTQIHGNISRPYVPTHLQPDTLIEEMHRPIAHINFTEEELQLSQIENYNDSLYNMKDGPSNAMSTRSGRLTEIISPLEMKRSSTQIQSTQIQELEDEDYEEDFGSTEADKQDEGIVININ